MTNNTNLNNARPRWKRARDRDVEWLKSRIGADKDPWIQAQIERLLLANGPEEAPTQE
jgi:hypothetical protein